MRLLVVALLCFIINQKVCPSTAFHISTSPLAYRNKVLPHIMKRSHSTKSSSSSSPSTLKAEIQQGVGDEGCALPSPTRINQMPIPIQVAVFVSVYMALFVSSSLLVLGYSNLVSSVPSIAPFILAWEKTFPILGLIFLLAGVTHFTLKQEFENIYPARGAWGIWYLPGSKSFHVEWTGVAECLGGLLLVIGGIQDAFNILPIPDRLLVGSFASDAAFGLLMLVIAVTPANIYMFTHGARLPIKGPEVGIKFHIIRGALQAIIIAMLTIVAQPTINQILV